jgi:hypothetical protein
MVEHALASWQADGYALRPNVIKTAKGMIAVEIEPIENWAGVRIGADDAGNRRTYRTIRRRSVQETVPPLSVEFMVGAGPSLSQTFEWPGTENLGERGIRA